MLNRRNHQLEVGHAYFETEQLKHEAKQVLCFCLNSSTQYKCQSQSHCSKTTLGSAPLSMQHWHFNDGVSCLKPVVPGKGSEERQKKGIIKIKSNKLYLFIHVFVFSGDYGNLSSQTSVSPAVVPLNRGSQSGGRKALTRGRKTIIRNVIFLNKWHVSDGSSSSSSTRRMNLPLTP